MNCSGPHLKPLHTQRLKYKAEGNDSFPLTHQENSKQKLGFQCQKEVEKEQLGVTSRKSGREWLV